MFAKKTVLTIIALAFCAFGHSQIITSKKEAEKKGIYQKPVEKKKTDAVSDKSAPKMIASADSKSKDAKPVKQLPKAKKIVLDDSSDNDLIIGPAENYLALQMINNAMSFMGVRYHGGGTTPAGMDCSGMVTAVFNIFDIKLPRSSNDMAKVGQKLDEKDIRKGDLIFFRTNGKHVINHVGMVVDVENDEIKFIHSSTNSGVIISSTKEPYYKKTFAQVNRVIGQM